MGAYYEDEYADKCLKQIETEKKQIAEIRKQLKKIFTIEVRLKAYTDMDFYIIKLSNGQYKIVNGEFIKYVQSVIFKNIYNYHNPILKAKITVNVHIDKFDYKNGLFNIRIKYDTDKQRISKVLQIKENELIYNFVYDVNKSMEVIRNMLKSLAKLNVIDNEFIQMIDDINNLKSKKYIKLTKGYNDRSGNMLPVYVSTSGIEETYNKRNIKKIKPEIVLTNRELKLLDIKINIVKVIDTEPVILQNSITDHNILYRHYGTINTPECNNLELNVEMKSNYTMIIPKINMYESVRILLDFGSDYKDWFL